MSVGIGYLGMKPSTLHLGHVAPRESQLLVLYDALNHSSATKLLEPGKDCAGFLGGRREPRIHPPAHLEDDQSLPKPLPRPHSRSWSLWRRAWSVRSQPPPGCCR